MNAVINELVADPSSFDTTSAAGFLEAQTDHLVAQQDHAWITVTVPVDMLRPRFARIHLNFPAFSS